MAIPINDFFQLRKDRPVVDVRSEGEFGAGHIPGAVNIPILNNSERVIVGTAYKQRGQRDAIREGFRLVGPRLEGIIQATEMVAQGKELLVHCWRGGMRSNNFCQFMGMAGIKTQSLAGGYKVYRSVALDSFKKPLPIVLLTGCTGSGKSEVLRALAKRGEQILDLECLASHKGSAFGGLLMPAQPTTEQFQNDLFEEILRLDRTRRVWVEDESLAIGKIFLPEDFWMAMKERPMVQMDVSKEIRVKRLLHEYGTADPVLFLEIMGKIVKKLGGQHYKEARQRLLEGDMASTIEILLTYYDKAYLESIRGRKEKLQLNLPWDGQNADAYAAQLMDQLSNS